MKKIGYVPAVLLLLSLLLAVSMSSASGGPSLFLPVVVRAEPTATPLPTATPVPPTATATLWPTNTPVPPPPATSTPIPPPSGANVVCQTFGEAQLCGWVSNGTPAQYTELTVYGRLLLNGSPQAGQPMTTTWYFRTTTQSCNTGTTDSNGVAGCTRYIAGATAGYQVNVDVSIGGHTVTTWFTPHD